MSITKITKEVEVLIIGGGFGGITLAKSLRNTNFDVLLIDKNNYHTFQPLLYQVATGGLEADSIAYPIRRIFRGNKNINFQMAEVQHIDLDKKQVTTNVGSVKFEYLVIANGSTNKYFDFEEVKDLLLPMKSVENALDIRSFLMQNLEKAATKQTDDEQDNLIDIAIVGGGPTGVELAGALAEMRRHVLPKDFPQINFDLMDIHLYEMGPSLLAGMSKKSSEKTRDYLEDMGIDVQLNAEVASYDGNVLKIKDSNSLQTKTVIWTAGVKGNTMDGLTDDVLTKSSRIKVNQYNQVKGFENVFAIGDIAAHETEDDPYGQPMLAPVAIQQAETLAKNLNLLQKNKTLKEFSYLDKGVMATIGRNKAVVDLPFFKFQGFFAWIVWMFVHVMTLAGHRNKVVTLIDWTANYFNYDRPLGLIIRKYRRKVEKEMMEEA